MSYSPIINVMIKAAEKASKGILKDFAEIEHLQVSRKGPADFVTKADINAENTIVYELNKARPDFSILSEEGNKDEKAEHRFIIDPIDGTTNFIHGIPHFAISIAYQNNGKTMAAVVLDPFKNELFRAERGNGAFLNDFRIRVSGRNKIRESIFATGIPFLGVNEEKHAEFLKKMQNLMSKTAGIRRFGAASLDLAYVACGRYEGFFEYGLYPWDIAAGILLVEEAGGIIVDEKRRCYSLQHDGLQQKWIISSNQKIAEDFFTILKENG